MNWYPINDGYGYIGWGWTCSTCNSNHNFVRAKIDTYTCSECHTEFENTFEED